MSVYSLEDMITQNPKATRFANITSTLAHEEMSDDAYPRTLQGYSESRIIADKNIGVSLQGVQGSWMLT